MTRIDTAIPAVRGAGPLIAAGRDAIIYRVGPDRVLRRPLDGRSMQAEADVMNYVRSAGYPAPRVHRVGPGELELDYVAGPTMLEDLLRHPWRLARHARLLAELHHRLHRIPACDGMPAGPIPGDIVVHLDLHPGNVLLGADGPVVIDWTNASRGPKASDVALTWTTLACFDHDATGVQAVIAHRFRAAFLDRFLAAAGRPEARPLLAAMIAYRLADPGRSQHVRPREREALLRLAAAATPGSDKTCRAGLPRT